MDVFNTTLQAKEQMTNFLVPALEGRNLQILVWVRHAISSLFRSHPPAYYIGRVLSTEAAKLNAGMLTGRCKLGLAQQPLSRKIQAYQYVYAIHCSCQQQS